MFKIDTIMESYTLLSIKLPKNNTAHPEMWVYNEVAKTQTLYTTSTCTFTLFKKALSLQWIWITHRFYNTQKNVCIPDKHDQLCELGAARGEENKDNVMHIKVCWREDHGIPESQNKWEIHSESKWQLCLSAHFWARVRACVCVCVCVYVQNGFPQNIF